MKNIYIGIFVLIMVVFACGCVGSEATYSANGVSFNYPSNWVQKASSEVSSDNVAYVYNPNDENTVFLVRLLTPESQNSTFRWVNQANLTSLASLAQSFKTINSGAQFISEKEVTINGLKGHEFIYTLYNSRTQNKAVILEKTSGSAYYLLIAGTPSQNFDQMLPAFDKIINSFKVQ